MPTIEHRIEADGLQPDYSGKEFTDQEIADGAHRMFIGGVWESHGQRQVDFLTGKGLKPGHKLLDVGCGCLRAGRLFVDYLEPGNYFGIDANHSLVQAGYDVELTDAQRERLPAANLRANDRFDADFGTKFDFAVAQSVYTHISLNHIRLSLYRIAKAVRPGGVFYATFFARDHDTAIDRIIAPHKAKPFFTEKNVFWYYREDLEWAASFSPWEFTYIGEWGHPANQKMAKFVRLTDEEWTAKRESGAEATATVSQGQVKGKPAQERVKTATEPPGTVTEPAADSDGTPGSDSTSRPEDAPASPGKAPLGPELKRLTVRGLRWAARRLDR